jgi:hypothetical protein
MNLLIIICSHEMNIIDHSNIIILNDFFKKDPKITVDYCGISNSYDFHVFEDIISFKYKVINPKNQIHKICDFITDNKNELNYDWYIKIRPDIQLLEPIDFNILSENAINARARCYVGPKKIKYGISVNGEGIWKDVNDGQTYDKEEKHIMLDDMIYIFHHNIINLGAFEPFEILHSIWRGNAADESSQTNLWISRNINLNVIGINVLLTKYNCFSGNINM